MTSISYKTRKRMLAIIIVALIVLLFGRGIQLELTSDVTNRLRFHSIPIAMSVLYHHHPHDYTGLKAIALPFQGNTELLTLIHEAKTKTISDSDRQIYYWVADDKGMEDYIIASFYLFGSELISMYYLWFCILLVSLALFSITYYKKIWAMGFMGLILLGIYEAISSLPLAEPATMYESRYFDVLALVGVWHLILFVTHTKPYKLKDIGALLCQVFLLMFLYHIRSSIGWEILAIFFCITIMVISVYKKNRTSMRARFYRSQNAGLGALLLIFALIGLNQYKNITYNPQYFTEMGVRTFWHNALMGLGVDPILAKKWGLDVSDFKAAESVISFAKQHAVCSPDIAKLEPQELLNTLGNWGTANWFHYESCARKNYFSILSQNKLSILKLYTFTKPLLSIKEVINAMRAINLPVKARSLPAEYNLGWHPFSYTSLFFLLIIMPVSYKSLLRTSKKLIAFASIMVAMSLIPSIAFYSCFIATIGGLLASLPIVLYMLCLIFFERTYKWYYQQKFYKKYSRMDICQ